MATISNPHKLYISAPLPFVGQKRMFAKPFIEVIKQYPKGTVFVDLFGGSGLLSHITKHYHPECCDLLTNLYFCNSNHTIIGVIAWFIRSYIRIAKIKN